MYKAEVKLLLLEKEKVLLKKLAVLISGGIIPLFLPMLAHVPVE